MSHNKVSFQVSNIVFFTDYILVNYKKMSAIPANLARTQTSKLRELGVYVHIPLKTFRVKDHVSHTITEVLNSH